MPRIVPVLACTALLAGPAAAAVVTLSDGDFATGDWAVVAATFDDQGNPVTGGSVEGVQQPGGMPGTMRQVTNVTPAAPSPETFTSTFGIHVYTGGTYDPAVEGPIGAIDYAEDARGIDKPQATGLALRQGGRVYYTGLEIFEGAAWRRIGLRVVTAAGFAELTAAGVIQESKPDFSATGAPLEFGFVRGNSTGPGGTGYTSIAAIDNWSVRVTPSCTLDPDCDDGADCTVDACAGGLCTYAPTTDFAVVEGKMTALLALLGEPACGEEPLARKLRRPLAKRLKKARRAVARADDATKETVVDELLDRADGLLEKARERLAAAADAGVVSAECAATLAAFLDEIDRCVAGLPRSE